jgi:hypothetical protein
MTYRQPDVRFTQVLDASSSSSGVPTQETCIIGPAFQIVPDETKGTLYDGQLTTYTFDDDGVVDIADDRAGVLSSELYPLRVFLSDMLVEFKSIATLGGSHTSPLVAAAGATFDLANGGTYITYDAADDAIVDDLAVGDFVELTGGLPDHWFLVTAIDTTLKRISFLTTGSWSGATVTDSTLASVRPFVPSSTEPGGTVWRDQSLDFSALAVSSSDLLKMTLPGRLAGRHGVRAVGDDPYDTVSLDSSFTVANREAYGTCTVAASSTAVSAITVDPSEHSDAADDEKLYAFFPGDGCFIEIASIDSETALTLENPYEGANTTGQAIQICFVGPETEASYAVWRERSGSAVSGITDLVTELPREQFDYLGLTIIAASVSLPAGLLNGSLPIVEAEVHLRYRALDESLKSIVQYASSTELQAAFSAGANALIPANPYGYATLIALQEAGGRAISAIAPDATWLTDRSAAMTEVLELLEEKVVYALVIADSDSALPGLVNAHAEAQSAQSVGFPRIALYSRRLISEQEVVAAVVGASGAPNGVDASGLTFTDIEHDVGFVTAGVIAGHRLEVTQAVGPSIATGTTSGDNVFTTAADGVNGIKVGDDLVIEAGDDAGTYAVEYVDEANDKVYISETLTTSAGSTAYHWVHKASDSPIVAGQHVISSVANDVLTFAASILGDLVGPLRSISYSVVDDLSLSEEAVAMAGVASGYGSRRAVMTFPDQFTVSVQNVDTLVPGWVGSAVVGGWCALELPHKGFSKKTSAVLKGRTGGRDRYNTTARLNTIAGGGVFMFEQDTPGGSVYARHQLTTDVSAILFQELSVTRNLDSVQTQLRAVMTAFLKGWNIQEGLFIALTKKVAGRIDRLIKTKTPKIGSQLRSGSRMSTLVVDPSAVDTLLMGVSAKVPVPLNNIDVTIEATA